MNGQPEIAPLPHVEARAPALGTAWKEWLPLVLLQALVAGIVLFPFLQGVVYFAYLDIASDTYVASAGQMHLARLFGREGFTGWSFGLGLGAPVVFAYNDVLGFLTQVAGPDHVLQLRIWVYLLKIALGGGFFFAFVRGWVRQREAALLAALAYSFCGYMVTNGVWDSEAGIYITAPLVLLGLRRLMRHGDRITFPLAVAAMLYSGVFFVMTGVTLFIAFLVCVAASEKPATMLRLWLMRIAPLAALGFLLAAPYVLPMALQLVDSPRVGGAGSMLARVADQGFTVSNTFLLLTQLGGLFHKDLFGIGGMHASYMNYLESPGFYIGMLPLVALPQLWRGTAGDRRMLAVGLAAVALYIAFPFFRLMAFGFAAPYFRGTTLWVALGLMLLGARALDLVLIRGVDLRLLAAGAAATAGVLALVWWVAPVSPNHAVKMMAIIGVWTAVLSLAGRIGGARLPSVLLGLLLVELVTIAWPSFFVMRTHASPELQPFDDVTVRALAAVRADRPPPFYRVEKTYDSFGQSDALAQDYFGVKSYYYHGRSIIDFHENMDVVLDFNPKPVNYTNWLPSPGDRFILHSVLGVRYLVSKTALDWPGLERIAAGDGYFAYRNELALPLGVVHSRQVTRAEMAKLSTLPRGRAQWFRDLALMNAVVLETPMPQWGQPFPLAEIVAKGEINTPTHYANPAVRLQQEGLQVTSFEDDHIVGTLHPREAGILVLSIPASRGWTLRIDGRDVEWFTADFGFIAAPVAAGAHQVELTYRLPGLLPGAAIGLLALLALAAYAFRARGGRAAGGLRNAAAPFARPTAPYIAAQTRQASGGATMESSTPPSR